MRTFRDGFWSFLRSLAVALITAGIILVVLIFGFRGQTEQERQLQEDTLRANLAQACVLALPVHPIEGRDPASVKLCFSQYGMQPPQLVLP